MSTIELEQRIGRAQLRIEQMRIHVAMLHPSQRATEARSLQAATSELTQLIEQLRQQARCSAPKAA
jgi:hypothetical protein